MLTACHGSLAIPGEPASPLLILGLLAITSLFSSSALDGGRSGPHLLGKHGFEKFAGQRLQHLRAKTLDDE